MMWAVIIVFVVLTLIVTGALMKVASDADDELHEEFPEAGYNAN